MKNTTFLINADLSENSNNAQDRNGKMFAKILSKKGYRVISFSSGKLDKRLMGQEIRTIKLTENKVINLLIILSVFIFKHYDTVINQKTTYREYILLHITKILFLKKFITFIVNVYPYVSRGKIEQKITDKILLRSDYLFSNSDFGKKTAIRYFQKNYSKNIKISVFNNLYSNNKTQKLINQKNNEGFQIITVASLQFRKGFTDFLNIAAYFPKIKFTWIGSGEGKLLFDKMVQDLNLNNVKYISKVKNQEIISEIRKHNLFLFPAYLEGFPNVIIESMQANVPVLTYSYYEPEAVLDGYNGFVVHTLSQMIEKVCYLNDNRDRLNLMANNCQHTVDKYFNEDRIYEFLKLSDHEI